MKISNEKKIVAIGIASALFVILMRFASIPSFVPNTSINIVFGFLAFISIIFGPIVGMLVGLIGHALQDTIFYGSPWLSWIIASGVFGLLMGVSKKFFSVQNFALKDKIIFSVSIIVVSFITWVIIAPSLDILIYAEPANKVYAQGTLSFASNAITGIILGNILLIAYSKRQVKDNSLSKDFD